MEAEAAARGLANKVTITFSLAHYSAAGSRVQLKRNSGTSAWCDPVTLARFTWVLRSLCFKRYLDGAFFTFMLIAAKLFSKLSEMVPPSSVGEDRMNF